MKKNIIYIIFVVLLAFGINLIGCPTESDSPPPPTSSTYKVTFQLNGGTINGSSAPIVLEVEKGTVVKLPSDPTQTDCYFWGWFTQHGYDFSSYGWGYIFDNEIPVTKDTTVYARWGTTAKPAECTAILDPNGGSIPQFSVKVLVGDYFFPPYAERTGYFLVGWNTGADGDGADFYYFQELTNDISLYAKWISTTADNGSFNGIISNADVFEYDRNKGFKLWEKLTSGGQYEGEYGDYDIFYDDHDNKMMESNIPDSTVNISADGKLNIILLTPVNTWKIEETYPFATPNKGVNIFSIGTSIFKKYEAIDHYYNDIYELFYESEREKVMLFYASDDIKIVNDSPAIWSYSMDLKKGWNYVIIYSVFGSPFSPLLFKTGQPGDNFKWVVEKN